jgi:iron complex outermembrane receptor protein
MSYLSIEDLMQIEITTVSKREQPLARTAAAVHVITREDIRRSGAASIPDLLRTAPGVHVSQLNAHHWAISARGFSELYASNMLVLVDGRNLYTPLFSGVYWDLLEVPLDDIERIEIVRGPGGTTWGANAVNGVINIITRHSGHTQGLMIAGSAGSRDRNSAVVRFGSALGANSTYRLYTKHTQVAPFDAEAGSALHSGMSFTQGGFRADTTLARWGTFTAYGTFFGGVTRDTLAVRPLNRESPMAHDSQWVGGASIQGEWQMRVGRRIAQTVRTYLDSWRRQGVEDLGILTMDLDWQQTLQRTDRHALTYGAGIRHASASYSGVLNSKLPELQEKRWISAFAESVHEIVPDKLNLTVGSKFEHDSLSGLNMQPSARLSFSPRRNLELWTSVSRAVRTPNWAERNLHASIGTTPNPLGIPNEITVVGNKLMGPEHLLAYEAGARLQVGGALSVDVAGFANRYSGLQSLEPQMPAPDDPQRPTKIITPLAFFNGMRANSRGLELSTQWHPMAIWKVSATHTLFAIAAAPDRSLIDRLSMERIYSVPTHQSSVISSIDLPRGTQSTTTWFYSGPRPFLGLESFQRLDSNLLWRATPSLDIGGGVRNLTGDRAVQYSSVRTMGITPEIDPGRRFFVQAAFRF